MDSRERNLKIPKTVSLNGFRMVISQLKLEDYLRRAVALYNRYRTPEAIAELIRASPENVTIAFSGIFCYSCSVLDYFEDFIYEFKRLTNRAELEIERTRQASPRSFEVDYKIKAK